MGFRARIAAVGMTGVALLASTLGSVAPASADTAGATGTITCAVTAPGNPVVTLMDTPVGGNVTCTHSVPGTPVTYSVAPFVVDATGPFNGKLAFDTATGNFLYTPGFYPPDPDTRRSPGQAPRVLRP